MHFAFVDVMNITLDKLLQQVEKLKTEYAQIDTAERDRLHAYRDDLPKYARDIVSTELTPKQIEIAHAVYTPPFRFLARSANNQGKTRMAAVIASHFYDTHDPSVCILSAPKLESVKRGMFRELRDIRKGERNFSPSAPILKTNDSHSIIGTTAATPDGFQGSHAKNQGMLFDEATGMRWDIVQRGDTMFQGELGHFWGMFYNPNDPSSFVNELEDNNDWRVIQLNALEHPNILAELRGLPAPIPSAIRLKRVYSRIQNECSLIPASLFIPDTDFEFPIGTGYFWRPKTIEFEAQVLGRWPLIPTESLLSPLQVAACMRYLYDLATDQRLVISCDVARFGADKTAICVRRGSVVLHIETHAKRDSPYVIDRLEALVEQYKTSIETNLSVPIYVDDTGGYGGAIVDYMPRYAVIPLNMASASPSVRYTRMRSALWFTLAETVTAKLLDFSRLSSTMQAEVKNDLIAPRYRMDENGRRILEPKVQTKARNGRSPDIGDSIALSMGPVVLGHNA